MWCPKCLNTNTIVHGTFRSDTTTERFRRCPECGFMFMSVEARQDDNYWDNYINQNLSNQSKNLDES